MIAESLYSLSEAARLLKKEQNRKLLRGLIRAHQIKHYKVGQGLVLDQTGFEALSRAVDAWDSRLRLSSNKAAINESA